MDEQRTLFETVSLADKENAQRVASLSQRRKQPPQARTTDPQSSHDAAARFEVSGRAASHRGIVIDAVYIHPGLTSRELTEFCHGMERHEVARRLPEAERLGEIHRQQGQTRELTWHPGGAKPDLKTKEVMNNG